MIATWNRWIYGVDASFSVFYTYIIVSLIALIITYIQVSRFRYWSKQGVNGPTPWPLVGNAMDTLLGVPLLDRMTRNWNKYGSVHGLYRGIVPHLVVGDPDMLKDVLVRNWTTFADRRGGCVDGNPITDNFLVSLSGEGWKRMRSVMSPTFTSGKMKSMFYIINECSLLMIDNIRKEINEHVVLNEKTTTHEQKKTIQEVESFGQKASESGKKDAKIIEMNLRHLSSCVSMDTIAKCCFATESNSFNDPNQVFVLFAKKFFDVSLWRRFLSVVLPNFLRGKVGFAVNPMDSLEPLADITKRILDQRSKEGHFQSDAKSTDYLQLLIEASNGKNTENDETGYAKDASENALHKAHTAKFKPLSVDEIISNSVLFFAVGYDTTSSLISSASYCLACNQDAQQMLYEELKRVYDNNGEKFEYETVMSLKYLDAVISETLRILPSVPIIERRVLSDYTFKKNGLKVPKGGIVTLPIYHMHHDAKFWCEPEKFDPSRFLPENRAKIIPYTYIPFGGGPRNCIGMKFALVVAKLALANLILNFNLSATHNTTIQLTDLTLTVDAVMFSPKQVLIGVKRRE